jgi:hypothetical protein
MAESIPPAGDRSTPPAMPRWVKLSAVVLGLLVLIFVILHLLGGGGPGRHMSGQGAPAITLALVAASSVTTVG